MKKNVFLVTVALFLISCSSKIGSQNKLDPIRIVKLAIQEPSGITAFNNKLFIVSDYNGAIYKTTLKGKIITKIFTKSTDLEGITYNSESKNIFIVDELLRELIEIDLTGNILLKIKVGGKQNTKNSGLEGICINPVAKCIYVVNEKSPKQLLKLNYQGKTIGKIDLKFGKDISGMCFDENANSIWIVSDESQKIYNITEKGKLIKKFDIPVNKAEGIVIYKEHIYIVSDSTNKLYIFKKPD